MKKFAAVLLTANPQHDRPDDSAMTKIDGRESSLRAMELMTNRDPIAHVLLAVDPSDAENVKRKIGSHLMFMGTRLVVAGGGWYGQLKAAVAKLPDDVTHVIVHDAARALVPYTDLESLLETDAAATALALPVRGLLASAAAVPGVGIVETLRIAQVLTPRAYDRSTIERVCETAAEPTPLSLIEGSPLNVRCGDVPVSVVKALLPLLPKPKVVKTNPFEEAQW